MTDTLLESELASVTIPYEDPDDGADHRTHIVNPPNNLHIWMVGMTSQEVVDIARATGQTVTALCGYTWVPKRNPEKYDTCERCLAIAGDIMREEGE